MKTPFAKTAAAETSPEQHLIADLAADPNVDAALGALAAATERFDAIRAKLHDHSVEAAAVKRESDARQALVRAQALNEIDQATNSDIDAARAEHIAARDALQAFGGRNEVLADELRKTQATVAEASEALQLSLNAWRASAIASALTTAAEGARLMKLAAVAMSQLEAGGYPPDHPNGLANWMIIHDVRLPGELDVPPVASAALRGLQLQKRAASQAREEIKVPKPQVAATASVEEANIAPSWPAPGMPKALTHDPLGNPLPEAKALLAQREVRKRGNGAPYQDGRDGVEEIH